MAGSYETPAAESKWRDIGVEEIRQAPAGEIVGMIAERIGELLDGRYDHSLAYVGFRLPRVTESGNGRRRMRAVVPDPAGYPDGPESLEYYAGLTESDSEGKIIVENHFIQGVPTSIVYEIDTVNPDASLGQRYRYSEQLGRVVVKDVLQSTYFTLTDMDLLRERDDYEVGENRPDIFISPDLR